MILMLVYWLIVLLLERLESAAERHFDRIYSSDSASLQKTSV